MKRVGKSTCAGSALSRVGRLRNQKQRVLALTVGDDSVASSRVRVGAPLAAMRSGGWHTERITATRKSWPIRFVAKLIILRPTMTIVQKVVPPKWFSRIMASLSIRLVFECDDAIQFGYDADPVSSRVITQRLAVLLPLCDCVTVSNAILGEDLRRLGAHNTILFPGPAPPIAAQNRGSRHGLLWLGSPATLVNVQSIVYPALDLLCPEIELTVIGASGDSDRGRIAERVWSMDLQQRTLATARVGVAPQIEDEWSLRKAFYKVLEYLAADLVPVVPASPAVQLVLGEELDVVAVTARDDSPAAWAVAIEQAFCINVDEKWTAARDRVFDRWNSARLARVMLG